MGDIPFFSIIIPTYNRANFIRKTIESVLNQTFTDFELIIIDDGSTDNTKEVITSIKDNRIRYYKKKNEERGIARNFGVKKSKGKYINFVDSDDILYNNHLQTAFDIIQNHNFPIFNLDYDVKNTKGENINYNKTNKLPHVLNKKLLKGNIISINALIIIRKIFNEFSFYEDRLFIGGEDWLLWLKISSKYDIYFINEKTSAFYIHENRSVLNFNETSFKYRTQILVNELYKDDLFIKKYGKRAIKNIHAHMLSYTSLHAALAKQKKLAVKYLIKAILKNPKEIFTKRFVSILFKLF